MRIGPRGRFHQALSLAIELHAGQTRKGKNTPYIAHLLSTASLVLSFGGNEDQAIAALLHDGPEDQGGEATLREIERQFGTDVAGMVEACTDTLEESKPDWRPRKQRYIDSIATRRADALLVTACDKLDNARAIATDLRTDGPNTLDRFTGGLESLWYYREVTDALLQAGQGTAAAIVARELDLVVQDMERLARFVGQRGS